MAHSAEYNKDTFMKKKSIFIGLCLFIVAGVLAFAVPQYTEPVISYTGNTVTFQNPNSTQTGGTLNGSVCVTFKDTKGETHSMDVQYSVAASSAQSYTIPDPSVVIEYVSTTSCYVSDDD
jgi:hypothetical protein